MTMLQRLLAAATLMACAVAWGDAEASKAKRDLRERYAFQRENPCPVNGAKYGPCPGYVIDHVEPLCAAGPDKRANMQWLTVAAHREKSRVDRARCRAGK